MPRRRPPISDLLGSDLADLPPRKKRERLTERDKLYILWARSQGLSYRRIAAALNATTNTIHQHYLTLIDDPELLFELPVLRQTGPREFECQFCGEYRKSRIMAMRHILSHFIDPEIAAGAYLGDLPAAL